MAWKEHTVNQGIEIDELEGTQDLMFGGLDLAERVDSTAFYGTKWDGAHLDEQGTALWPHIKYPIIIKDLQALEEKFSYEKIGFDETGHGVAVGSFFTADLPMEPLSLSQRTKDDAVNIVKLLMQYKVLRVRSRQLLIEMQEQEKYKSANQKMSYRHSGRHDDLFWACTINAYTAVPYIIGVAPAAIVASQGLMEEPSIDEIIRDVLTPYSNTFGGHSW